MSINLNKLNSARHSIEIKNAAGQALALDGSGFITSNINGTVTVSATDLDTRDLVFATDKVDVSGSSISATDLDIRNLLFATDKVDVSGSSISATDLDIRNLLFATDKVDVSGSSISVDQVASWKMTAETVGATESELVSTPLTGRIKVEIQNLDNSKDMYIGPVTGVLTTTGLAIPAGSSWENNVSASADIFAIGSGAGIDVRVAEYAI